MSAASEIAREEGFTAPIPANADASDLEQFAELLNYIGANGGLTPAPNGAFWRPEPSKWREAYHPARKLVRIWMMAQPQSPAGPNASPAVAVFAKWIAGQVGGFVNGEDQGHTIALVDAVRILERDATDAVVERNRREGAKSKERPERPERPGLLDAFRGAPLPLKVIAGSGGVLAIAGAAWAAWRRFVTKKGGAA